MRHAASGLDGCRGCACYARRRRESTCENRTGTARSGLTRRPAAPCRGPASGVLPLPRACCCCSPSTQAKETLMKEASVPPMVEEKKLPKRGASKIARPRPAAGDEEENLSARRRRRKFCHCSLQKCLEHDGLVTPPDDIKVPESTQQMSNHWNVSGADGQWQHVQHSSDHFIPHWAAARKWWRGYAWREVEGSDLRAKEATKPYPRRLKKCRPHRARPFGAGLERPHDRRDSPRAHERRPLL